MYFKSLLSRCQVSKHSQHNLRAVLLAGAKAVNRLDRSSIVRQSFSVRVVSESPEFTCPGVVFVYSDQEVAEVWFYRIAEDFVHRKRVWSRVTIGIDSFVIIVTAACGAGDQFWYAVSLAIGCSASQIYVIMTA